MAKKFKQARVSPFYSSPPVPQTPAPEVTTVTHSSRSLQMVKPSSIHRPLKNSSKLCMLRLAFFTLHVDISHWCIEAYLMLSMTAYYSTFRYTVFH